jgi:hypothetical protein
MSRLFLSRNIEDRNGAPDDHNRGADDGDGADAVPAQVVRHAACLAGLGVACVSWFVWSLVAAWVPSGFCVFCVGGLTVSGMDGCHLTRVWLSVSADRDSAFVCVYTGLCSGQAAATVRRDGLGMVWVPSGSAAGPRDDRLPRLHERCVCFVPGGGPLRGIGGAGGGLPSQQFGSEFRNAPGQWACSGCRTSSSKPATTAMGMCPRAGSGESRAAGPRGGRRHGEYDESPPRTNPPAPVLSA